MDSTQISAVGSGSSYTQAAAAAKSTDAVTDTRAAEDASKKAGFSDTAATYEKSQVTGSKYNTRVFTSEEQRTAFISQMKADMESRQKSLMDIVNKTIQGQGNAISNADDMWKFLASGDFTVDAATKAQAQKDIADDGYWGVGQTSDRIVDFAKALSGGDSARADEMIEAFQKGFKEATKSWGKTLPDISQKTYDAVMDKMNKWKNGKETTSTDTASKDKTTQSAKTEA
ncbi:MAG: hypothetical protein PUG68_02240 [Lachnospiraceae bacterium]|nr:hypothetical protein [Lachnospiraceae bacterium]MDD7326611.1 hypothetical protein [Lachnospiraceae bacterium]MDY2758742.1 hypothetical protein [Lachnospiraceae bacterium]